MAFLIKSGLGYANILSHIDDLNYQEFANGYKTTSEILSEAHDFRSVLGRINTPLMPNFNALIYGKSKNFGNNLQVDIKEVDPKYVPTRMSMAKLERMVHSVHKIKDIASDPNIAPIYEVMTHKNIAYVVSEHTGGDMLAYMEKYDYKEATARKIASQILRGFRTATNCDISHKNLNPACIMVDKAGKTKITGFGLPARLCTSVASMDKYKAPEVIRGERKNYSKESNVFAIGAIIYEALHGHAPQFDELENVIFGNISEDAKILLAQMLHPNYWARPTPAECLLSPWFKKSKNTTLRPLKNENELKSKCSNKKLASINCGSEKILLRSRVPSKEVCYGAGANYVEMYADAVPFKRDDHIQKQNAPRSLKEGERYGRDVKTNNKYEPKSYSPLEIKSTTYSERSLPKRSNQPQKTVSSKPRDSSFQPTIGEDVFHITSYRSGSSSRYGCPIESTQSHHDEYKTPFLPAIHKTASLVDKRAARVLKRDVQNLNFLI